MPCLMMVVVVVIGSGGRQFTFVSMQSAEEPELSQDCQEYNIIASKKLFSLFKLKLTGTKYRKS